MASASPSLFSQLSQLASEAAESFSQTDVGHAVAKCPVIGSPLKSRIEARDAAAAKAAKERQDKENEKRLTKKIDRLASAVQAQGEEDRLAGKSLPTELSESSRQAIDSQAQWRKERERAEKALRDCRSSGNFSGMGADGLWVSDKDPNAAPDPNDPCERAGLVGGYRKALANEAAWQKAAHAALAKDDAVVGLAQSQIKAEDEERAAANKKWAEDEERKAKDKELEENRKIWKAEEEKENQKESDRQYKEYKKLQAEPSEEDKKKSKLEKVGEKIDQWLGNPYKNFQDL